MADDEATGRTRRVFVAMDGSKHAESALNWYCKHVHRPKDKVYLAYCAENIGNYPATIMMAPNPSLVKAMARDHEEEVQTTIKKLEETAKKSSANLDVKVERLYGHPGDAIVKSAYENKADMIVCGSRGQGIVRRTILGSISEYILHHTHLPVVVCKHEDEQNRLLAPLLNLFSKSK